MRGRASRREKVVERGRGERRDLPQWQAPPNPTQPISQSDHTATHETNRMNGSWPCFAAESPKLCSKNSTREAKEIWDAFCSCKKRQKRMGWSAKNWHTDNTDTHHINEYASKLFKTTVRPATIRFTLMITGALKQRAQASLSNI